MAIVLPGRAEQSSIVVQTRTGWSIPNCQSYKTCRLEDSQLKGHRERYPEAVFRTGPVAGYNCHGLTFASRRTAIWETSAVNRILDDDRYEEIAAKDALPGDIVLYISSDDGDIEHSGIVVEAAEQRLGIPVVLSKWGFGAEVVHMATRCPYDISQLRYRRIRS